MTRKNYQREEREGRLEMIAVKPIPENEYNKAISFQRKKRVIIFIFHCTTGGLYTLGSHRVGFHILKSYQFFLVGFYSVKIFVRWF